MKNSKKISKLSMLILTAIFLPLISFSQKNLQSGYIVNLTGDTLNGYIDYNWKGIPGKISFRVDADSEWLVFTPSDIKEFGMANERYIAARVQIESSPIQHSRLDRHPELNLAVATVFLQTIIKGDKSLYRYRTSIGTDNFFIEMDSGIELLTYKKYLAGSEGTLQATENKRYLNQLSVYFGDCQDINSLLFTTSYNVKDLEKLFLFYHECRGTAISFISKKERIQFQFGVLSGISFMELNFNSNQRYFEYLADTDFSGSNTLTAGIFAEIIVPENRQRWSLYNELAYSSYNTKGEYLEYNHVNHYTLHKAEFDFSYIK